MHLRRLSDQVLGLEDVVTPEFFERLSRTRALDDRDTRSFKDNIPHLLPWAACLVDAVLDGPVQAVRHSLQVLAATDFATKHHYDKPFVRLNGLADLAIESWVYFLIPPWSLPSRHGTRNWGSPARSQLTAIRCSARNPALAQFGIAAVNQLSTRARRTERTQTCVWTRLIEAARAI